jgi:hypothetical protein
VTWALLAVMRGKDPEAVAPLRQPLGAIQGMA